MSYRIPDENFGRLSERIAKLSKKAEKLCGQPIVLTTVSVDDVETKEGSGIYVRFHNVTVDGPRPKLNGWTLVASLQHLVADGEEVTVVRAVPGESVPAEYRNGSKFDCDHCHTHRNRTETFIVRHEDGSFKKVGRQCIADFLGHKNPEDLVKLFEYLFDAAEAAESEVGASEGGGRKSYFDNKTFLDWVVANIRCDGWLSRTNARNAGRDGQATADQALSCFIEDSQGKAIAQKYHPTDADRARVQAALDFMEGFLVAHAEDNDYLHNLSVVIKVGNVDWKLAGIAASIIPTAEREMGKEIERRQWANLKDTSNYLGAVGGKLLIKATVAFTKELDSEYGVTTMIRFVSEGNVLTWFASGNKTEEFLTGLETWVVGTVKKHEEYQGLKQTVLTRVNTVAEENLAEVQKSLKKAARKSAKKLLTVGP